MNWITRLYAELAELVAVMASKLNKLHADKEDKANKKQTLSSTNANDFPSVPAVNAGLDNTLQAAQTYADLKIGQNNANFIPTSQKAVASGVATLDGNGQIPTNQLPALAIKDTFVVAGEPAMLALNVQKGDAAIRTDINKTFFLMQQPANVLANWQEVLTPNDGVQSVDMQVPVGFSVTGGPITNSGLFDVKFQPGYSLPTNAKQTEWNEAHQHMVDMGNANTAIPDWSTDLQNQVNF